jgi:hypothetical protein
MLRRQRGLALAAASDRGLLAVSSVIADVLPHLSHLTPLDSHKVSRDIGRPSPGDQPLGVSSLLSGTHTSFNALWARRRAAVEPLNDTAAPAAESATGEVDHHVEEGEEDRGGSSGGAKPLKSGMAEDADVVSDNRKAIRRLIARTSKQRTSLGRAACETRDARSTAERRRLGQSIVRVRDHQLAINLKAVERVDRELACYLLQCWFDEHGGKPDRWPTEAALLRSDLAFYGVELLASAGPTWHGLLRRWVRCLEEGAKQDDNIRKAWCTGAARDGVVPYNPSDFVKWVVATSVILRAFGDGSRSASSSGGNAVLARRERVTPTNSRGRRWIVVERGAAEPPPPPSSVPTADAKEEATSPASFRSAAGDADANALPVQTVLAVQVQTALEAAFGPGAVAPQLGARLVRAIYPLVIPDVGGRTARGASIESLKCLVWLRLWRRFLCESHVSARKARREKSVEPQLLLERARERVTEQLRDAGRSDAAWGERRARPPSPASATARGFSRELAAAREFQQSMQRVVAAAVRTQGARDFCDGSETKLSQSASVYLLASCASALASNARTRGDAHEAGRNSSATPPQTFVQFVTEITSQTAASTFAAHGGAEHFERFADAELPKNAPFKLPYAVLLQYFTALGAAGDLRVIDAIAHDVWPAASRRSAKQLSQIAWTALQRQASLPDQQQQRVADAARQSLDTTGTGESSSGGATTPGWEVIDLRSAVLATSDLMACTASWHGVVKAGSLREFRSKLVRTLLIAAEFEAAFKPDEVIARLGSAQAKAALASLQICTAAAAATAGSTCPPPSLPVAQATQALCQNVLRRALPSSSNVDDDVTVSAAAEQALVELERSCGGCPLIASVHLAVLLRKTPDWHRQIGEVIRVLGMVVSQSAPPPPGRHDGDIAGARAWAASVVLELLKLRSLQRQQGQPRPSLSLRADAVRIAAACQSEPLLCAALFEHSERSSGGGSPSHDAFGCLHALSTGTVNVVAEYLLASGAQVTASLRARLVDGMAAHPRPGVRKLPTFTSLLLTTPRYRPWCADVTELEAACLPVPSSRMASWAVLPSIGDGSRTRRHVTALATSDALWTRKAVLQRMQAEVTHHGGNEPSDTDTPDQPLLVIADATSATDLVHGEVRREQSQRLRSGVLSSRFRPSLGAISRESHQLSRLRAPKM